MLDSRARLGDAVVTPLLTLGKGLVASALPLDLIAIAVLSEPVLPIRTRVTPIRIDIAAGVPAVDDRFEVLAVMDARGASLELTDDLVLGINVDRDLVAEVVLAVLERPDRVGLFLPPFSRLPVPAGTARSLTSLFSSRLLRCLGAGTSVASTI